MKAFWNIYFLFVMFMLTFPVLNGYTEGKLVNNLVFETYKIVEVVDGDTVKIEAPFLPDPLEKTLLVRVQGVDTPEKGFRAHCALENTKSLKAKDFTETTINNGKVIKVVLFGWDKYGGRILGDVIVDNKSLSELLVDKGYGVRYHGEKKDTDWCN